MVSVAFVLNEKPNFDGDIIIVDKKVLFCYFCDADYIDSNAIYGRRYLIQSYNKLQYG